MTSPVSLSLSSASSPTTVASASTSSVINFQDLIGRLSSESFDPKSFYSDLFEYFSPLRGEKLTDDQFEQLKRDLPQLKENLLSILGLSSDLIEEQGELALLLAEGQTKLAEKETNNTSKLLSFLVAMDFTAKAYQIGKESMHDPLEQRASQFATTLLIKAACSTHSLEKALSETDNAPLRFKKILERLAYFQNLYCSKNDLPLLAPLYNHINTLLNKNKETSVECREFFDKHIRDVLKNIDKPKRSILERYRESLDQIRESFTAFAPVDIKSMREFQGDRTKEFQELFQIVVSDAIALLGRPPFCKCKEVEKEPCSCYDMRAIGSMGREEECPYSDLELLVLLNPEHLERHIRNNPDDQEEIQRRRQDIRNYFELLIHFIDLQTRSLGESNDLLTAVFTAIHTINPSGFHIDKKPSEHPGLMGEPLALAEASRSIPTPLFDFNNDGLLGLKSGLILGDRNSPLFITYQEAIKATLEKEVLHEHLGWHKIRLRILDFKNLWGNPSLVGATQLKTHYVELLNHVLGDLALYFGVFEKHNTLDIIDALMQKGIFTSNSAQLLKWAVFTIHQLRIQLHTERHHQVDELDLSPFNTETKTTKATLEKIYWLVLRPLYVSLENAFPNAPKSFQQIDLVATLFQEILKSKNLPLFFPCLPHLVAYLAETEPHILLLQFKKLSGNSDLEPIRTKYFEAMQSYAPTEMVETASEEMESYVGHETVTTDTSIRLKHGITLKPNELESFLHPDLQYLDLSYCLNLQDRDIVVISKTSPTLQELRINGNSKLTIIKSVVFSSLQHLHASECASLTGMQITAPNLRTLTIRSNQKMTQLQITTNNFPEIYFEETPISTFPLLQDSTPPDHLRNAQKFYIELLRRKIPTKTFWGRGIFQPGPILDQLEQLYQKLDDYPRFLEPLAKYHAERNELQQRRRSLQKILTDPAEREYRLSGIKKSFDTYSADLNKMEGQFIRSVQVAYEIALGQIDLPSPLPEEFFTLLAETCPLHKDTKKLVKETHIPLWIPKSVNGEPLTILKIISLLKEDRGFPAAISDNILKETVPDLSQEVEASHWVLMTIEEIPKTAGQNRATREQNLALHPSYRAITAMEALVAFALSRHALKLPFFEKRRTACEEQYSHTYPMFTGGRPSYLTKIPMTFTVGPPINSTYCLVDGISNDNGHSTIGLLGVRKL